ncbi:Glutathione S-transferase 2; AltName: Full=GST-II [Serendipita indica DSM 11827]|nr:Glutathione S-transferase 2; AltName: Full=GST-II [Serendipita indica DSM 11827]
MESKSPYQFTVYNHEAGVNIWKILILLKELNLSYKEYLLDFGKGEHKEEWYRKMMPNGRIPMIVDHWNNDKIVWESNAVMKYIAGRYDTEKRFLLTDPDEQTDMDTWLFFQASHQGPYFGALQWFSFYHEEPVPSAVLRYAKETRRILGVLDTVLKDREWLVGGKITIADIAFIKCNEYATKHLLGATFDFAAEFPHAARWHGRMMARPCVREVFKYKAEQDCGRERQHVTGETVSAFAQRMGCGIEVGGIVRVAV